MARVATPRYEASGRPAVTTLRWTPARVETAQRQTVGWRDRVPPVRGRHAGRPVVSLRTVTNDITHPSNVLRDSIATWRGSKLTRAQVSMLHAGKVVRPPMFVKTTINLSIAENFREVYLIKFNIRAGCRNAFTVESLSEFKAEREVLLPPYTPCMVDSIIEGENLIVVSVLDGMDGLRTINRG